MKKAMARNKPKVQPKAVCQSSSAIKFISVYDLTDKDIDEFCIRLLEYMLYNKGVLLWEQFLEDEHLIMSRADIIVRAVTHGKLAHTLLYVENMGVVRLTNMALSRKLDANLSKYILQCRGFLVERPKIAISNDDDYAGDSVLGFGDDNGNT